MTYQLLNADLNQILSEIRQEYERRAGKKLFPAHIENSLIQIIAYREYLLREAINYAFNQNFTSLATGQALDLIGEMFACYRLESEDDESYRKRLRLAPQGFTTCGTQLMYEHHARAVKGVQDAYVTSLAGGRVDVYVLAEATKTSEEVNRTLIDNVQAYLSDPSRRALCDNVLVHPAEAVEIQINATLDTLPNYNAEQVLANAKASLAKMWQERAGYLGQDVIPIAIEQALFVEGVYNVNLTEPSLTKIAKHQWAKLTQTQLQLGETLDEA